ncbi:MAG TPA: Ni/Fe-hydrogenase cytochrome b subunit [Candidatus Krumholzibacteria bacterium]|nr:Ni/Fe-hydrogenase cytochrome b subunit [Candidatus Krumholzibacteria bacterium]HRX52336.1 Ni/Fe-hydrogenase cytochrome b subunit [Candidatus Krumholzibacteria bacterium]
MSNHHKDAAPIMAPVLTTTFKAALLLSLTAIGIVIYRFANGLGPVTAMTDTQPWGIWKLFNVIALTAVASGGYAVALLVYVLNRGKYHSLVRHGLLTSAVGYTTAIFALGIDVGSPWNFWKVFGWTWAWNFDSVLLEVALCITAYLLVLWSEMSPAFLERWSERSDGLGKFARAALPRINSMLIWIIGLGILLPTMHQSSLGSLYILAGPKVHPFWQTPGLPLFFLLSCWILGYAAVVLTYIITSARYNRHFEQNKLLSLGHVIAWIILAFLALRVGDLAYRGQLGRVVSGDPFVLGLLAEFLLLGSGAVMLLRLKTPKLGVIFRTGVLIILGGVLYRVDAVWIGFRPVGGAMYFPSLPELIVTMGFISMQVVAYLLIIKNFPILDAMPREKRPNLKPQVQA